MYNVTIITDNKGTASAKPASAESGTEIALAVTPKVGYQLKSWEVIDSDVTIKSNKFTMPDNGVTLKVKFELIDLTRKGAILFQRLKENMGYAESIADKDLFNLKVFCMTLVNVLDGEPYDKPIQALPDISDENWITGR